MTGESVPPPRTVLVLRFSALGDIILTSPAIHALKTAWPDTRVVYVTKQVFAHLVHNNPQVERVVTVQKEKRFGELLAELRALEPDAVLDLHGKLRSRILRNAVGASRSVVWTKRRWQDTLPVKLQLRPYRAEMLLSDRFHHAVEELVGRPLPRGELRYFLGAQDQASADQVLAEAGVKPNVPLVGMSPGANWQTKRWPAEHFRGLARRVVEHGAQVILTGSAAEADVGAVVAQADSQTAVPTRVHRRKFIQVFPCIRAAPWRPSCAQRLGR